MLAPRKAELFDRSQRDNLKNTLRLKFRRADSQKKGGFRSGTMYQPYRLRRAELPGHFCRRGERHHGKNGLGLCRFADGLPVCSRPGLPQLSAARGCQNSTLARLLHWCPCPGSRLGPPDERQGPLCHLLSRSSADLPMKKHTDAPLQVAVAGRRIQR